MDGNNGSNEYGADSIVVLEGLEAVWDERLDVLGGLGLLARHRADADVLVVSEETGNVSFVRGGEIQTVNDVKELRQLLGSLMTEEETE